MMGWLLKNVIRCFWLRASWQRCQGEVLYHCCIGVTSGKVHRNTCTFPYANDVEQRPKAYYRTVGTSRQAVRARTLQSKSEITQLGRNKKSKKKRKRYLLITMNHVARMQVLGGSEQLIHDILFVHFLEDIAPFDDIVEVSVCKM